jgi:uncharacterized metal-binding protein
VFGDGEFPQAQTDGCEDHCGRKIMENAGRPVDLQVDVTTLGIEMKPGQPALINNAKRVVDHVKTCSP